MKEMHNISHAFNVLVMTVTTKRKLSLTSVLSVNPLINLKGSSLRRVRSSDIRQNKIAQIKVASQGILQLNGLY